MTAKIIYEGNLRTKAEHIKSCQIIQTDAPTDNKGTGEAFSPTDLMATSLASCALTIMGIYANQKDIDIVGSNFATTKVMGDQPRRIIAIENVIEIPNENLSQKERTALENAAINCPVSKSIHPDIEVSWNFKYPEDL